MIQQRFPRFESPRYRLTQTIKDEDLFFGHIMLRPQNWLQDLRLAYDELSTHGIDVMGELKGGVSRVAPSEDATGGDNTESQ